MAVLNGYGGVDLLASIARNVPLRCMYAKVTSYGRIIPGVCGFLLFMGCMDHRIWFALREFAVGTTATALTWMVTGIAFNARNRRSWMGSASNGLSATDLPESR